MKKWIANNKLNCLIYVVLIVVSVLSFLFWTHKKEIYYSDEVYTYESVNGIEQVWPRTVLDEWMSSDEIRSYLAADSDYYALNQISTVLYGDHVPLFFWLTRIISVTFFKHKASVWIVYSSSLVFYLILISALYSVLRKAVKNPVIVFLLMSVSVIYNRVLLEQVTMLRMYIMMLCFDVLLLILGLKVLDDSKNSKLAIKEMIALTVISLCGLLTHYDFWIFYACTAFCFCLYMLFMAIHTSHKKFFKTSYFKNIVGWVISFLVSIGTTVAVFPYCVWNLHKDKGWTALTSLSSVSSSKFSHVLWGISCLSKSFFGKIPVWLGVVIIIATFTAACFILAKEKKQMELTKLGIILSISVLYQIIVCFTLPDAREERYIWCSETVLFICFLYALYVILKAVYEKIGRQMVARITFLVVSILVAGLLFYAEARQIEHGKGVNYLFFEEKDINLLKNNSDIPWVVYGPCEAHSFWDFTYSSEICFMSNTESEEDYEAAKYLIDKDSFLIYAYEVQVADAERFFESVTGCDLKFEYLTKSTNYNVYVVRK